MSLFLIILSAAFSVIGTIPAKIWADRGPNSMFLYAIIFFTASSLAIPFALKYGKLTTLNAIWTALAISLVSLVGLFYFKEKLSPVQWTGLILAFAAIVLLSIEET